MSAKLPAIAKIPSSKLPVNYEVARRAIAECARIDECKEWADKALALAAYAKQAKDKELEDKARKIRARAVERQGALIDEREKGHHRRRSALGGTSIDRRKFADGAGLSKKQQITAQRVHRAAEKDRAAFERRVESLKPPTIKELAAQGRKSRTHDEVVALHAKKPRADINAATRLNGVIASALRESKKLDVDRALNGLLDEEFKTIISKTKELLLWLSGTLAGLEARWRTVQTTDSSK